MSIIIKNLGMPIGCQKCKFFRKHMFGNGLDYSYYCILGAKDFPMPWIRQMEERASDCPIEPLEQVSCEDVRICKKDFKVTGEIEEAIKELKRDIELENDFTDDYINAVKMGIKALEFLE